MVGWNTTCEYCVTVCALYPPTVYTLYPHGTQCMQYAVLTTPQWFQLLPTSWNLLFGISAFRDFQDSRISHFSISPFLVFQDLGNTSNSIFGFGVVWCCVLSLAVLSTTLHYPEPYTVLPAVLCCLLCCAVCTTP